MEKLFARTRDREAPKLQTNVSARSNNNNILNGKYEIQKKLGHGRQGEVFLVKEKLQD